MLPTHYVKNIKKGNYFIPYEMFMEGMTLIMLVMNDAIVVHLDLHVKWYRNFCGLVLKGWCIFNG